MAKSVISDLLQMFKSSVSAVLPESLIQRNLKYNSTKQQLTVCGNNYNLQDKNVYLVGFGKAVRNMAVEVENILNSKLKQGIISVPEGSLETTSKAVSYCQGAKDNLPDANAVKTTKKIMSLVTGLTKDDLLLVLISGGGSALLTLPKPPVSLEEKTQLIKKLANSGAEITELNTVRKRLSEVKGGKLAMKAHPAHAISLILSDIVENPIDLIASGPTVENTDDYSKALAVIHKYNLNSALTDSIKAVLEDRENPKPFPKDTVKNHIIGCNKLSIKAAVEEAERLNYIPIDLSNSITGNVKIVAEKYAKLTEEFCKFLKGKINYGELRSSIEYLNIPKVNLESIPNRNIQDKDLCLILGGEITVEVKGTGKGGRNQQLALEYSNNIDKIKSKMYGFDAYLLSAGTDGIDGPTPAAGAIGYKNLISDAKKQNIDVDKYLDDNDSYNFYREFRDGELHVITGHTNTNVIDIHLILIRMSKSNH